jgi:hypothetical protein
MPAKALVRGLRRAVREADRDQHDERIETFSPPTLVVKR